MRNLIFIILFIGLTVERAAAEEGAIHADTLYVDLAGFDAEESTTLDINPGEYAVKVLSLVPVYRYGIRVYKESEEINPLDLSGLKKSEQRPQFDELAGLPPACDSLIEAGAGLENATAETQIENLLTQVNRFKYRCGDEDVKDRVALLTDATQKVVGSTINLKRGEQVTIEVVRRIDQETWTVTYSTGSRGKWRTTYGFSFVTRWPERIYSTDTYFAEEISNDGMSDEQVGEAGQFIIRERENRVIVNYVPTIFFSFVRSDRLLSTLDHGPVLGIGFDLNSPVLFAGYGITYNQNLSLNVGATLIEQPVLRGRYDEGDVIDSNLEFDQLHEDLYRVGPFVSLSIRSLSNPFQGAQGAAGD